MSGSRRGFLAFVGSALVSGSVARASAGTAPTLIMPPALLPAPAWPLLAAERSQMDAIIRISMHLPRNMHRDWLEGGLRQARPYEAGYDHAAENRRVEEAVAKHGGLIEAIQVGAL